MTWPQLDFAACPGFAAEKGEELEHEEKTHQAPYDSRNRTSGSCIATESGWFPVFVPHPHFFRFLFHLFIRQDHAAIKKMQPMEIRINATKHKSQL